MKSVLISIRPEWCEKIANKVKSLEIRKTVPKLKPPFKVYIYCTSGPPYLNSHNGYVYLEERDVLGYRGQGLYKRLNPGVIGEFVCDAIISHCEMANADIAERQGCIKREDLLAYANGGELFGWHISDLVIYEKPKKINKFVSASILNTNCFGQHLKLLDRPPQSWCYVEEA